MAEVKNLNDAIVRQPEGAGVEIERKSSSATEASQARVSPKMAGAAGKDAGPLADPFSKRRSDARPVSGRTPRPTDKSGE